MLNNLHIQYHKQFVQSSQKGKAHWIGLGSDNVLVNEAGMDREYVAPQCGSVAATVRAVWAEVRSFTCVGQCVLLQVVFARAPTEHLATHAALLYFLLTSTLQSKHTLPQLSNSPRTKKQNNGAFKYISYEISFLFFLLWFSKKTSVLTTIEFVFNLLDSKLVVFNRDQCLALVCKHAR